VVAFVVFEWATAQRTRPQEPFFEVAERALEILCDLGALDGGHDRGLASNRPESGAGDAAATNSAAALTLTVR
jgi:hypothetical protein